MLYSTMINKYEPSFTQIHLSGRHLSYTFCNVCGDAYCLLWSPQCLLFVLYWVVLGLCWHFVSKGTHKILHFLRKSKNYSEQSTLRNMWHSNTHLSKNSYSSDTLLAREPIIHHQWFIDISRSTYKQIERTNESATALSTVKMRRQYYHNYNELQQCQKPDMCVCSRTHYVT